MLTKNSTLLLSFGGGGGVSSSSYFIFFFLLFDDGTNNKQPAHCCHFLFNFFGLFVAVARGGNEQYTCCHSFVS